jgi:hypothetical protein
MTSIHYSNTSHSNASGTVMLEAFVPFTIGHFAHFVGSTCLWNSAPAKNDRNLGFSRVDL